MNFYFHWGNGLVIRQIAMEVYFSITFLIGASPDYSRWYENGGTGHKKFLLKGQFILTEEQKVTVI